VGWVACYSGGRAERSSALLTLGIQVSEEKPRQRLQVLRRSGGEAGETQEGYQRSLRDSPPKPPTEEVIWERAGEKVAQPSGLTLGNQGLRDDLSRTYRRSGAIKVAQELRFVRRGHFFSLTRLERKAHLDVVPLDGNGSGFFAVSFMGN